MASILDALNQNTAAPQAGMTGDTQKLAGLLRAKSGKAGVGPSLAGSLQQEQAAVAETNQGLQQVNQAANIQAAGQAQQSAGMQQQQNQQMQSIDQSRQFNTKQTEMKTNQILQGLEEGRTKLDTAQFKAGLEQVGQGLRLQNKQYVDNLQREGSRARLDNELQFKEQLQRATFDDNQMLLNKNLKGKSILNANDREFNEGLAQMGVQDAYMFFRDAQKDARTQAQYAGAGALATAGIGAYGSYQDSQNKPGTGDTKPGPGFAKE